MTIGIYIIRNRETGHIYCGSSTNCEERWRQHVGLLKHNKHSKRLQQAWNKFGESKFDFIIIKHCQYDMDGNELRQLEQQCLNMLKPWLPKRGYNISKRAEGIDAETSRQRQFAYWNDAKRSTQNRQMKRSIKFFLGKKHTSESIECMRRARLKYYANQPDHRKRLSNAMIGNKNHLGKHHSKSAKAKLRLAARRHWHPELFDDDE
jgi:group I intron endonuclease